MSWHFVSSGPSSGSVFQLTGPSITIGRAAESGIVIDDNMVSRHHARLDMQGNTYIVTDLGSASGWDTGDGGGRGRSAHIYANGSATTHSHTQASGRRPDCPRVESG